ncbi:hypothetical protein JAAARDRAFT_46178 [Jaapia argillacea MUCL 33604]|uniref:DUF6532 domain-containing protein n=1 Tax=Jaapia argillacea MUCL 33604 TaxID=933084 RepID=A0A067QAJ8_9AGAM|nr:hypothetical protein JAAARDRAFT_46178 [Jaapia argillacea MUCL 33604]
MASQHTSAHITKIAEQVPHGEVSVTIPPNNKSKKPCLTIKGPSINPAEPDIQPGKEIIVPMNGNKGGAPEQWDPLPPHTKRVIDPGVPDKPAARQTSEEVTAAAKRKAQWEMELEELEAKKIATMAKMCVEQQLADEEEEKNTVRYMTDLHDPEDKDGEAVTGVDDHDKVEARVDEETMDVDEVTIAEVLAQVNGEAPQTKRKAKKKKGQSKGELRAAVDAAGKDIIGAVLKQKPMTIFSEMDAKPLYSSGLTTAYKKKAAQKLKDALPSLGGLADEDAEGAPPPKGSKHQGSQHRNELVTIDSNSDSEMETEAPPKHVAKKTQAKAQPKTTATPKRKTSKPAATPAASTKVANVQPEAAFQQLQAPLSTQDDSKLPDSVTPTWVAVFLPTLYAYFSSSRKAWTLFTMTVESVPIVVKVFEKSYPSLKIDITLNGKIFKTFFSNTPYANDTNEIAKYAQWASRPNSPGICKDPTPIDCKVLPQDPKYVQPQGIFESDFVIALLSAFLKSTKGLKDDFGYPKGAIAMAAAAIERAFQAYANGAQCKPKMFSQANYMDVVNQYLKHAHSLSENWWKQILEASGSVQAPQDAAPEVTFNALSLYLRDSLYTPSSPIQGSDDKLD